LIWYDVCLVLLGVVIGVGSMVLWAWWVLEKTDEDKKGA
jgi:hypothetical protein